MKEIAKETVKVLLTSMSILLLLGSGIAGIVNGIIMWLHFLNGDEFL